MGKQGAIWFPAHFFNLKKIPQELTHTQRSLTTRSNCRSGTRRHRLLQPRACSAGKHLEGPQVEPEAGCGAQLAQGQVLTDQRVTFGQTLE